MKKVETDLVKLAKDNTECRRLTLGNSYLINTCELAPIHNCCDVCEKNCECSGEKYPNVHIATGDSQTHVLQPELIHGLTDVISDIVVKSEILFTPDDVMKNCQIWSYETGVEICNIITDSE